MDHLEALVWRLSLGTGPRSWMTSHVYMYLWIAATHFLMVSARPEGGAREYCQFETFNASCGPNEVILMKSAMYGRMRFGRCVQEDHGNIGCSSNVIRTLDSMCSGLRTCEVPVPIPALRDRHACPKEVVPYLEAEFACLTTQSGSRSDCMQHNGITVPQGHGFLASVTPLDRRIGINQCPWIIEVQSGQRINFTLYDFGNSRQTSPNSAAADNADCSSDIVVIEGGRRFTISACGQLTRDRVFYISNSNQTRLYIENRHSKFRSNFIIEYSAVGCPDFSELKNAWSTRTGDTAVVRCNFTGETFFLSCDGSRWKGELGNCTKSTAHGSSKNTEERDSNFPYGLLIVIGIGVALGVAFGILMLFGILFCLRRRRQKQTRGHTMDPLLSEHPQDPEDMMSNIYDKTRFIRCPHGLAAINLNPESPYYPEGLEQHPASVSLTTVSGPSPYSLDSDIVQSTERGDTPMEGIYSRDGDHKSLTKAFSMRKNEMQTSFMTFRPSVIQEDLRESMAESAYRSLHKSTENSLDLLRDSRPYRELNPESLECNCTPRHGSSHTCANPSETERTNSAPV